MRFQIDTGTPKGPERYAQWDTQTGSYRYSHILESPQVSEIAVGQFPGLSHVSPEVVVCHETIHDTNAAGKAREKEERFPGAHPRGMARCRQPLTGRGRALSRAPEERDPAPHPTPPSTAAASHRDPMIHPPPPPPHGPQSRSHVKCTVLVNSESDKWDNVHDTL